MDIRDIARLSGYGTGTVSRVLNGHPNVSDRARARVLEVIEEQGYEPNDNARYLKMQSKTPIVAFVKGANNLLFADLLERIQALLLEQGEEIHLVYLEEDEDEVRRAALYAKAMNPKGIIFLGGDPANFEAGFCDIATPSVLLTNSAAGMGYANLSSFSTDDAEAARQMIEELIASGHGRIGIIGGNRSERQVSQVRLESAVRTLAEHGILFDYERDFESSHFSMDEGYQAVVRLLMNAPDITAVFALGDVVAFGALRAINDMGRSVPEDISLVGFDGIEFSQFCTPRLTTVGQDTASLAKLGVDTLLKSIAGELEAPVHKYVPFRMLRRESVRKLVAGAPGAFSCAEH